MRADGVGREKCGGRWPLARARRPVLALHDRGGCSRLGRLVGRAVGCMCTCLRASLSLSCSRSPRGAASAWCMGWRGACGLGGVGRGCVTVTVALHNSNIIRSSHPLKDSTPHVSIVHYTRTTHQISLPLQDSRVYHLSHTALATISTHIFAEPVLGRRRAAGVMQSFFDTSLRRRRHHASCESLSATNSSERSSTRMSRTAQ